MNRRSFLLALLGAPTIAALVAACSDDDSGDQPDFTIPTGADDVVLRITHGGGLMPPDADFTLLPALLVTGDGRWFTPGAVAEIYPGPLVRPMAVRTIAPAGLQRLMKAADAARLIGLVPDYDLPEGQGIYDASTTVVTLTVNANTYTHTAYALGIDQPTTPERRRLHDFVDATGDPAALVGAGNLGADDMFEPAAYRFLARVVDPAEFTDPDPTIVPWPAATGVVLADSGDCATVTRSTIGDLFANANELTFFQQGDVVYRLAVVEELPGDTGCTASS